MGSVFDGADRMEKQGETEERRNRLEMTAAAATTVPGTFAVSGPLFLFVDFRLGKNLDGEWFGRDL